MPGTVPEIRLYNTAVRDKVPLDPVTPGRVGMYVCGPTVYDRAHIGNARPVVVFDVLFRLLHHVHGADNVTYVRNITDIDDKINARAAETGRSIREITDETAGWFMDDTKALGALPPTHQPRATEYVPQMVAMIEILIARGHAYEAEGHVLFKVASYPEYGRLARRSLDEMRAGARVEVAPYKRDPMDFVLWKPSTEGQPGWDSPWGHGRPGWHIECSAMAYALLGESFDIHGGGIDLAFPHHENELAQSRCAHPDGSFASIWMHNGFLNVEGEKMSKSLGNFFTVRDLLDRGVPGEVIRFVLLSTHYRQPIDWTEDKVEEAKRVLVKWREIGRFADPEGRAHSDVLAALSDDLNTPAAIEILHRLADGTDPASFVSSASLLGLLTPELDWTFDASEDFQLELQRLVDARDKFRSNKNYELADKIRKKLAQNAIEIMDSAEGATWKIDYGRLRLNYAGFVYGLQQGVFPASWSNEELEEFLHTRVKDILIALNDDLANRGPA